jgi:hypothetical protein
MRVERAAVIPWRSVLISEDCQQRDVSEVDNDTYRLGGSSFLLLWALFTGSYFLTTPSGGPPEDREDCDSRSSRCDRGSLTAAASLEACRLPLIIVERNNGRTSLIVSRLNAEGMSRSAMTEIVKAIDFLSIL